MTALPCVLLHPLVRCLSHFPAPSFLAYIVSVDSKYFPSSSLSSLSLEALLILDTSRSFFYPLIHRCIDHDAFYYSMNKSSLLIYRLREVFKKTRFPIVFIANKISIHFPCCLWQHRTFRIGHYCCLR